MGCLITEPADCYASNKGMLIGMLHVPVNSVLAAPESWRSGLPPTTLADWRLFDQLENEISGRFRVGGVKLLTDLDDPGLIAGLEEMAGKFSFISFLEERLLQEAELYHCYGIKAMMLENIAAPYFTRERQPVAVLAVISRLAGRLRRQYSNKLLGLQILAFSDDLALVIAAHHGLQFIRSETALFAGLRPEGTTPNRGNLALLYAWRNRWQTHHPERELPRIYVDLCKKHTFFPGKLAGLEPWVDNLEFQKIEGVILTGPATGQPVDPDELCQLNQAVNRLSGVENMLMPCRPVLLVGSGVTLDNLAFCCRYADGCIVGSFLKKNGFWENQLDEERLRVFTESWQALECDL